MSVLKFSNIVASDPVKSRELGLVQDEIINVINILNRAPFLDGIHKKDVSLVSGDNGIGHGLDRKYTGMLITKSDSGITTFINSTNINKDRIIIINSSGIATIDVWIF